MNRRLLSRSPSFSQVLAAAAFLSFVLLAALPARSASATANVPGPSVRVLAKVARQAYECGQAVTLALPAARRDLAPPPTAQWVSRRETSAGHTSATSESLHNRAPPQP